MFNSYLHSYSDTMSHIAHIRVILGWQRAYTIKSYYDMCFFFCFFFFPPEVVVGKGVGIMVFHL